MDEYSALFNQLAKQRADAILTAQLNVLSVSEITNDLKKHQSEINTLLKVHYIEWTLASDEETDAPSKLMESIFTTIYK